MKQQTRPPAQPPQKTPNRPKGKTPGSYPPGKTPTSKHARKVARYIEPEEEVKIPMSLQQKVLAGIALGVVVALFILLAVQPQDHPDRQDQNNALGTALAATGVTPPPTIIPGSDFGVDLVVYGIKDYVPVIPGEKITFYINNKREKSLYVSNCDGTILQRFKGTDLKDKAQYQNLDNWENIAPGGAASCGPVGKQSVQIPPGANADASFPFDTKKTRPYQGQDWNIPGNYRLFIQYYLLCPSGSEFIADCTDKHITWSDSFKIVAPQYITVTAGATPASPAATPTPTP